MDDDLPQPSGRPDDEILAPDAAAPGQTGQHHAGPRILRLASDVTLRSYAAMAKALPDRAEAAEGEWEMADIGEGTRVETGVPGVERIDFAHPLRPNQRCAFVYVPKTAFPTRDAAGRAALMDALRPIAAEPGQKIFLLDDVRMSVEEFFAVAPYGSEAIDGFATGYNMHRADAGGDTAEVTDHHVYHRSQVPSSSMQVFLQARDGTARRFPVGEGLTVRNMFLPRIDDLDERLSLFGRLYADRIAGRRPGDRLERMYSLENMMDVTAGSAPHASLDDFAELNWIDVPVTSDPADTPETAARKRFDALRETFRRAQAYVRGEGGRIEPVTEYQALRTHSGWASVCEPVNQSAAKWKMHQDGYAAILMLKGRKGLEVAAAGDVKGYTIQKLDPTSAFPLGRELYGFMNFIEGLRMRLPQAVASEQALLAFLQAMDRNASFEGCQGPFGGDNVAGGGKTTLPWNVLDAAVQWFVTLRTRTPDRANDAPPLRLLEDVRDATRDAMGHRVRDVRAA